ncbi:hypothetical protein [Methanosarcina sp. UBA5]|uniref:hypothetical protein n=1 Tax=Methanosarcina sp. UBA5 TaxID=1915593 RepID=UPI0025ED75BE|nr:hypothetical protein [Methanosarcina sp. UBA5]
MRQFSYLIISIYVRAPADITTKQYYKVLKVSDFSCPSFVTRVPSREDGALFAARVPFREDGALFASFKRAELWIKETDFQLAQWLISPNLVFGRPAVVIITPLKKLLDRKPFQKRLD